MVHAPAWIARFGRRVSRNSSLPAYKHVVSCNPEVCTGFLASSKTSSGRKVWTCRLLQISWEQEAQHQPLLESLVLLLIGASPSTELRRWSPSLLNDRWALCVPTFLGNYIVLRLEKISKPEKKIRREKQTWHSRVNDVGKAVSGSHLVPACLQRGGFGKSAWEGS